VDVGTDGDAHERRIVYSVPTRLRLPFAIVAALAVAEAAATLLRPRDRPVPVDVAPRDYFSDAELDRARRYREGQLWLHAARTAIDLGLLGAVVARPPRPLIGAQRPVLTGAGAAVGLTLAGTLATLPVSALSRQRSRRVGLVTQSWGGWAGDLAKGLGIESALAAAGGALLVAGTRRLGPRWWLPGAGVVTVFGLAASTAAPVLLEPLFNRFTPLPDGPLRRDVLALADRAGVRVGEVYDVDASRRTTAANAYVSGLGPTKRVVLFDTLTRDFTPQEVRFVVAHELGHQRFRDVPRGLLYLAAVTPFALLAIARLGERLAPAGEERGPAIVPATALAMSLLVPAIGAAGNQLSRGIEVRADRFAIELTGDPRTQIDFQRRITVQNVADPHPPRWVRILLGTHPTTMERIGHALAVERAR
jgi:Zn-dependent protease with chaperone function